MDQVDLNAIRAFVAVARTGSFIAGGRSVGLSRSAAGKALVRLEARLGVRLLNRTTRSVGLTADGASLYERYAGLLADFEEAEASVGPRGPQPRGTLRLTVPDAFGRSRLVPLLGDFLLAWPEVEAEVNFTDREVDLVENGLDLAVRIGASPMDPRLIARVVARHRAVLCAAPSYLDAQGVPEHPGDLAGHRRLVFAGRSAPQRWSFHATAGEPIEVGGPSRLRFDSAEGLREAALHGLGVAYLPDFLVERDLSEGALRLLLPTFGTEELPIFAAYPHRKLLPAKVRLFIDLMVERWR